MFPIVISALMHLNWFTITENIWALVHAVLFFYYGDTLLVDLGRKKKLTQILLYLLAFAEGHIKTWCSGALQCWTAFVCILRVNGEGTDMYLVKAGIASAIDNYTEPNQKR